MNIAHRGASAYAKENTLSAIEEAIKRKADMVEFDLRQTADNVIVLYHDPYIDSKEGKRLFIDSLSYSKLCELTKENGFDIATLPEVLRLFGSRIRLNLEIKTEGFEKEVLELLKKYPPLHEPVISSFKISVIKKNRILNKKVKLGVILGCYRLKLINLLMQYYIFNFVKKYNVSSIHLNSKIARKRLIEKFNHIGVSVYIWTINDIDKFKQFIKAGVQGIITDKPDLLNDTFSNPINSKNISKENIATN